MTAGGTWLPHAEDMLWTTQSLHPQLEEAGDFPSTRCSREQYLLSSETQTEIVSCFNWSHLFSSVPRCPRCDKMDSCHHCLVLLCACDRY